MGNRLLNLFRRRRLDFELDAELRHHMDSLEAEYRSKGLSPDEARSAAHRDFGGVMRTQDEYRDQRGLPEIEDLIRDVRIAVRSLSATKAFTAAVIATLAIGIGATTVIFSVVNGVLLKPLPYAEPDRLISLSHVLKGTSGFGAAGSADFLHLIYSEQNKTFQATGVWNLRPATITGRGDPEQIPSIFVSSQVLSLLGVPPARGHLFTAAGDQPGNPFTTVLSYRYWQRKFGGDESILGQRLMIDGQEHEIVGVMPRNFDFLDQQVDLFRPVRINRSRVSAGNFSYSGIARLKPGITIEQASTDMARMIPTAIESFPPRGAAALEQFRRLEMAPKPQLLKDTVVGNVGDTLWLLMGTIGMVLLIACANVANLFLVRTEGRHGVLAVRAALGAGRFRIAFGLLTEAAVLATAGGVLGFAVAYAGLWFLLRNAPPNLPRLSEIEMDGTVLVFATLLTVGTAFLFGLAPSLRYSAPRLSAALRSGGRAASLGPAGQRTRAGLVISQVGLALVLLIACGLMLRTYQSLITVDPGFKDPESVQLAHIVFARGQSFDAEQTAQSLRQMVEAAKALPGVTVAAYASSVPLENGSPTSAVEIEGLTAEITAQRGVRFISPQFFQTLGVPLLAGRDLEWVDYFDHRNVAMVSESLAKEVWGSPRLALGKHVRANPSDPWREIVGVARNVYENGVNQPIISTVYFPYFMKSFWNNPTLFWGIGTLVLRTPRAGSDSLMHEVQRTVWNVDGSIPLATPSTMGVLYQRSLARTSFTLVLLSVAGLMALLLGIVGIYGVVSYAVTQRTREIGIRLALGASPGGVQRLFTRQAMGLVAMGTAIGLVAASGLTRLMESLLFGVSPLDPSTFLLMPAVLVGIAMLASYLPTRRALRVNPMEALRED